MKVVILAGGLGTRLSEETQVKPKPMVELGGMPILWHIMKIYSHFGLRDFVICLGYKGEVVKEWFARYHARQSDVTFDFARGQAEYHSPVREPWRVTLVDTGAETMTGGRVLRVRPYLEDDRFLLTYGDGVADIDIKALLRHHGSHGRLATVTTVVPDGRFGAVEIGEDNLITAFSEKKDNHQRISAGFFVFEPDIFAYLTEGDATVLEQAPLQTMSARGELVSYPHDGFWHPMDTLSDKHKLDALWAGNPPWKLWKE